AGDADEDAVPLEVVARQERFQGLARELVGVGIRLAEDLGVFDVVEMRGRDLAVHQFQTQRLEGTLAQVDAPDAWILLGCHIAIFSAAEGALLGSGGPDQTCGATPGLYEIVSGCRVAPAGLAQVFPGPSPAGTLRHKKSAQSSLQATTPQPALSTA